MPKARCSQKRVLGPAQPAEPAPAQHPEQLLVGWGPRCPFGGGFGGVSGMVFVHLVAQGCRQKPGCRSQSLITSGTGASLGLQLRSEHNFSGGSAWAALPGALSPAAVWMMPRTCFFSLCLASSCWVRVSGSSLGSGLQAVGRFKSRKPSQLLNAPAAQGGKGGLFASKRTPETQGSCWG